MKIAMLAPRFPACFDGVGDHAAKFARELLNSGLEVLVLTEGLARDAGGVHAESAGSDWALCSAIKAATMARRFGADVFYIQYTPFVYGVRSLAPLIFGLGARLSRAKVAIYVHEAFYEAGSSAASTPLKAFVLGARDLIVIALADYIFVAHDQRKAMLVRFMPWRRRDSIVIAPNGANVEPYGELRWSPPAAGSRRRTLVAFGIISPRRRLELIIDAFVTLIRRGLDLELHFVGRVRDADYAATLACRSRRAGVEERVEWLGALDPEDASKELIAADALLFASTDGTTASSGVLLAGLAHGVPVIAVETSHDEKLFSECVQRADPDAASLADAIEGALSNEERLRQLGEMGARLYNERFQWSRMTATIVTNLRKTSDQGRPASGRRA
jgi:glycosyltransferase involved in cell wall biosynthesis